MYSKNKNILPHHTVTNKITFFQPLHRGFYISLRYTSERNKKTNKN